MNSIIHSLKNSVNIVTGANGSLGRSTVKYLFDHGAKAVLGIDCQRDKDINDYVGIDDDSPRFRFDKIKTFEEEKMTKSVNDFASKFGAIDNLMNLAGMARAGPVYVPGTGTAYKINNTDILNEYNILGTFVATKVVAANMISANIKEGTKKPKCIINASSISVDYPSGGQSYFAAACSAIESSTLASARDLAQHNIRVNTICIGYFRSKLLAVLPEDIRLHLVRNVLLFPNRLGHPTEFAHFVRAIIENQMINGACIKLHAGASYLNSMDIGEKVDENRKAAECQ